jgi:hypothetical protein
MRCATKDRFLALSGSVRKTIRYEIQDNVVLKKRLFDLRHAAAPAGSATQPSLPERASVRHLHALRARRTAEPVLSVTKDAVQVSLPVGQTRFEQGHMA